MSVFFQNSFEWREGQGLYSCNMCSRMVMSNAEHGEEPQGAMWELTLFP